MMNKIYQFVCAGLIACSFCACNDELEALPGQSKVDGNVVVDQASAIVALNGVYYTYAQCGTDNYDVKSTGCSSFYEIMPADFAGTAVYYQGPYMFETHDVQSISRYGGYFWTPQYGTVNAANALIKQVNAANDNWFVGNKKQEILGEAYAMRALADWNLLMLFGYSWDTSSPYGIINRTEQSTTLTLPKGRSTVKESYDQILSDLDFAIANAPTTNDNCYISKWAAKGLKARVLMQRGEGSDYQDAAALCADIINNGPYALEDNVMDIFHTKGLGSSEVIFGIMPKDNQTDVYETYFYRGSPQYNPSEPLLALFEGDPRKEQMFFDCVSQAYYWDENGELVWYDAVSTAICKHLTPGVMQANTIEETQYQLRLTEIYLLRAEALAHTGDLAGAGELLKTVMGHAGIEDFSAVDAATTKEAMLQQIFNEALRNLSFECGLEHCMMLRFPESITLQFNPAYTNKQYNVFPIPSDEFKYNYELKESDQNPGYTID
ncbi:MAG: RagB/SusD family nutrient uptake outer membrane protein [Prevotella sp.]|nr:RagB/SusD family nutrient uptake outer membrane protein [Prevotella sp.]